MKLGIYILLFITMLMPGRIFGQYLYFSPTGDCSADGVGCGSYFSTYYVFINVPQIADATGASFRLESEEFGPEDFASVDPHDGVNIESGDLFSGITLSWPTGQYSNDTLLTIPIERNEPHASSMQVAWTRDIEVYIANGDTLYMEDFLFFCSHCYGSWASIQWQHPDTFTAAIGKQTVLDISCVGSSGGGLTGTDLDVSDQLNWVDGCTQCGVACDCAPCPWDLQHVLVSISIPEDMSEGTVDFVQLTPSGPCCLEDSTSFFVKAISETGVEGSSWGKIKSLYKDR